MNALPKPLPDTFHAVVSGAIDEEGVYPHQAMWLDAADKLTVCALDLNRPSVLMGWVKATVRVQGPKELIYALDRFCKPGQGTTLGDAVAGAWLVGGEWKPFVIEYQHAPRVVKPIAWDNAYWTASVLDELGQVGLAKGGAP